MFWKDDIRRAMEGQLELDQAGVPKTDKGYQMTLQEIQKSKDGIESARVKLKEALARLTQSDKDTWKDKGLGKRH